MKNECNCKENWDKKCSIKCYDLVILNDYNPYGFGGRLKVYAEWGHFAEVYKWFVDVSKNDKKLVEYLKENYTGDSCYYNIGKWVKNITETKLHYIVIKEDELIKFVMNYLYWSYGVPSNLSNLIKKENNNNNINLKKLKDKYSKATIRVRTGQKQFREKFIKKYGYCQICGVDEVGLLIASHSKPYVKCNDEECIDVYNGLLLCKNHDGLYDKGYITFNDEGNIIISNKLTEKNIEKLGLNKDIKIELELQHKKYLAYHRENIFENS